MERYLKNLIVREICETYSQICAVPVFVYNHSRDRAEIFQQ